MTENKQIIINGADVSGCDFYDKNKKYCLTLKMNATGFKNPSCFSGDFQECIQNSKTCPYTFCDNNPNCYFKQLARKTQECEELNKTITNLENIRDGFSTKLDQLKAEKEQAEEKLKRIKDILQNEHPFIDCSCGYDILQIIDEVE